MKRFQIILTSFALTAGTAAVQAQIGSGWTQYFPSKTIQQVNGSDVAHYSNINGVETFEIIPGSNRSEARVHNDYTSGMQQFEGEVRVSAPTDSQSIHQKFPNVLIRAWNANGGEIRMQSGTVMISGCYGTWVRLNSIHDVSAGWVYVYINGTLKGGRDDGTGTSHYHKYGVYGTLHTSSAKSEWRNVKFFRDGTTNVVGFSGNYRIVARHSGKDVVVQSASTADGANIFQYSYTSSDPKNDEWTITSVGSGYYKIIARHSGKAMVVQSASTADGANVFQWTYGGSATNDEWSIVDLGGGYYRIVNRNSGKVLNVSGSGTTNGTNIDQWSWTGGNNQQFQIIPL